MHFARRLSLASHLSQVRGQAFSRLLLQLQIKTAGDLNPISLIELGEKIVGAANIDALQIYHARSDDECQLQLPIEPSMSTT